MHNHAQAGFFLSLREDVLYMQSQILHRRCDLSPTNDQRGILMNNYSECVNVLKQIQTKFENFLGILIFNNFLLQKHLNLSKNNVSTEFSETNGKCISSYLKKNILIIFISLKKCKEIFFFKQLKTFFYQNILKHIHHFF